MPSKLLVGIPPILILSAKNKGVEGEEGGLLNRQNPISMTKVIFRQSLRTFHPPARFDKSLYVGTYVCGKIAGSTKMFYRPN